MVVLAASCTTNENSPGLEYMPDMYRSPAIEAYVDYGMDPWFVGEEKAALQRSTSSARKPVVGSIPYVGAAMMEYVLPYPYKNTPEDYELAGTMAHSPLSTTKANAEAGQVLYNRMCMHCHGEAGEGDGKISQNGFIMGIPSYTGKLKDLPEGKMFHTLTYGKGLMGSHASQLSQYERWLIIEYVKVLQNGGEMPAETATTEVVAEEAAITSMH